MSALPGITASARTSSQVRKVPEERPTGCGRALQSAEKWAANPRLKTEDRPLICARYKSSLDGDFNDICNKASYNKTSCDKASCDKACGPSDRFDCALRFKYRAIPANAE